MSARDDSPWSTTGQVEVDFGAVTGWDKMPAGSRRQLAEDGAPAFATAAAPGRKRAWAVWRTKREMEASAEPIEHGVCGAGEVIDPPFLQAVRRALAQPGVVGPAHEGEPSHINRWRRKKAQQRRNAFTTSSSTEARIAGYVYVHFSTFDFEAARATMPSPRGDRFGADADAWERWYESVPRRWHVQQHRVVRRTPKLIFALREPGPTFAGRDLDGVTIAECFAFPRAALEAGRLVERSDIRIRASLHVGPVWVSLAEYPPADAVLARGGTAAPEVIAKLGLSWPCSVADVKRAYKQRSHAAHPDGGGTHEAFVQLRAWYRQALALVEAAAKSRRAARG